MTDYRQVGGRLGAFIRAQNPSTQQIQSLLSDLLPGDDLLSTMRDVVGSQSFQALQPLAGSGEGAVLRDAVLQEVARRFLPEIVNKVGQVLDGLLELPAREPYHQAKSTRSLAPTNTAASKARAASAQELINKDKERPYQRKRLLRYAIFIPALLTAIALVDMAWKEALVSGIITATSKWPNMRNQQTEQADSASQSNQRAQVAEQPIATDEGKTRYGHPIFDPSDGHDWTFYKHFDGVDWYLDPKSKQHNGDTIMIMMRSVQPDNINFGTLLIDCKKEMYSAYYEPLAKIDLSRRNLVTSLFMTNCNLPVSRT